MSDWFPYKLPRGSAARPEAKPCRFPWTNPGPASASRAAGHTSQPGKADGVSLLSGAFRRMVLALGIAVVGLALSGCDRTSTAKDLGGKTREISVQGKKRTYDYIVPTNTRSGKIVGVVLAFHGATGSPSTMAEISLLHDVAGAAGFVVVYPAGYKRTWNDGLCCGPAQAENIDDIAFVKAMIGDLKKVLGNDRLPFFATGFSNGAKLVYRLACTMSDQFAAVAPVGATPKDTDTRCSPSRPVPLLHIHGLKDVHAPYQGGEGAVFKKHGRLRSVPDTLSFWVRNNRCSTTPDRINANDNRVDCITYSGCANNAQVASCSIADLGHHWPGSFAAERLSFLLGQPSSALNASATITEFFLKYTR